MPDVKDQPHTRRLLDLRALSDAEGHQAMCDTIEAAKKGSTVVLPLEDAENPDAAVSYIYDGMGLLFRSDTKLAAMLVKDGRRIGRKEAQK